MAEELYNSLFDKNGHHEGTNALVAALAQMGRLDRAARELANDEMMEGTWVHEEEAPEQAARYAADDRSDSTAVYAASGYSVAIAMLESGWTATQTGGKPGASLKFGNDWVVLSPGEPVALPITELPEVLILVDLSGREIPLKR